MTNGLHAHQLIAVYALFVYGHDTNGLTDICGTHDATSNDYPPYNYTSKEGK